jgi:hypothetical protein
MDHFSATTRGAEPAPAPRTSGTSCASAPPPPARLTRAIDAAALGDFRPTKELRGAVCAYVDALKAQGFAPERVLVAVKGVARGLPLDNVHAPLHARDELAAELVQWCIARYFAVDSASPAGRP